MIYIATMNERIYDDDNGTMMIYQRRNNGTIYDFAKFTLDEDLEALDECRLTRKEIKRFRGGEELLAEIDECDSAVIVMDDEIREDLHVNLAPCSMKEFLDTYKTRHLEKYGKEFDY